MSGRSCLRFPRLPFPTGKTASEEIQKLERVLNGNLLSKLLRRISRIRVAEEPSVG